MSFKEDIKDFFYFTKGERNGIFVLILLIFVLIIIPNVYLSYIPVQNTDFEKFKNEVEAFENSLIQSGNDKYENRLDKYIAERYDTLELFFFDPNSTSDENFKKLGLTDKQIKTIRNYLNKGGKFYTKDDFRKIYGIRQAQYLRLKPYILLSNKISPKGDKEPSGHPTSKQEPFTFDPNILPAEEFKKLGLTDKQVQTIENYRNKGGKFYKAEDFKKIYNIDDSTYNRLYPFIKIENKKIISAPAPEIEINAATYEELISIKGIGDYLAKNIIYYRNKLGGFTNKEQLLEIKNLRKTSFEQIKHQITVDTDKIQKININFADSKELANHPYLNYRQAKAITDYRTKNGAYLSINQLLNKNILNKETFNKIKPYLTVQ